MLWSRGFKAIIFATVGLAAAIALPACTMRPVYSGALAENPSLDLAYARPASRLEQVIYQELSLRLGEASSPTATLAAVSVSTVSGDMMLSRTDNPNEASELTLTATLTLTRRDGTVAAPVVITRVATANYTRNNQALTETAAKADAEERAARSVAESLRLAVLALTAR